MAQSKKTEKKTATKTNRKMSEQPADSVAATKGRTFAAVRRVPVQYTPRIPTTRCPWC